MSHFMLMERLDTAEKVSLVIAFVGVFILIEGGRLHKSNVNEADTTWAMILLIFAPILIAAGNIVHR
jgi:drug/metabolite transporter (DMT)-like permease